MVNNTSLKPAESIPRTTTPRRESVLSFSTTPGSMIPPTPTPRCESVSISTPGSMIPPTPTPRCDSPDSSLPPTPGGSLLLNPKDSEFSGIKAIKKKPLKKIVLEQSKAIQSLQETVKNLTEHIQQNHVQIMDLLIQSQQKMHKEDKTKIVRDKDFQGPLWPLDTIAKFDEFNKHLKNQIFRDQLVIFVYTYIRNF